MWFIMDDYDLASPNSHAWALLFLPRRSPLVGEMGLQLEAINPIRSMKQDIFGNPCRFFLS